MKKTMLKIELTNNGKHLTTIESRSTEKEVLFMQDLLTILHPFCDDDEDFGDICKKAKKDIEKIVADWNSKLG